MNILDLIILVILGFSAFGGYKDGFLRKLIFLTGTILALIFATKISGFISKFLMQTFSISYAVSLIICYILIFVTVSIISGYIYKKIVNTSSIISIWDKIGGVFLGVVESGIILSLIFLFLNLLNFPSKEMRDNSLLYPLIYNFAPEVFNFLKGIIPGTGEFFRELKIKT